MHKRYKYKEHLAQIIEPRDPSKWYINTKHLKVALAIAVIVVLALLIFI